MRRNVLIIGEKYREVLELFAQKLSSPQINVMYLSECKYSMCMVTFYLSFDLILSPYRLCLMHIALNRQFSEHRPLIVLATAANRNLKHLVSGQVCDEIWTSFNFRRLRELITDESPQSIVSSPDRGISSAAFVEYMAYIARDHHGESPEWASLSIEESYPAAMAYYRRKERKDMTTNNMMLIKPSFPVPDLRANPELKTCFMIMPFTERLSKIYRDIIKPTIESIGIGISRGDDFFTTGSIMEDVWRRVCLADFLIADLTGKSPNVYYELGIAHTIGKPVILLTQSMEDVPFDVRDKRVIIYGIEYDDVEVFKMALRSSVDAIREEHRKQFPESMSAPT